MSTRSLLLFEPSGFKLSVHGLVGSIRRESTGNGNTGLGLIGWSFSFILYMWEATIETSCAQGNLAYTIFPNVSLHKKMEQYQFKYFFYSNGTSARYSDKQSDALPELDGKP